MTPESEIELAEMITRAKGPLHIQGGGTRPIGRSEGEMLSTAQLSGISLYEPGALTIVAGAGTPLAEIEKTLASENQRLAFEPMDHRTLLSTQGEPTVGGMVATNASGPRRIAVGACRDFMLGVRFVDGSGTIVKNGGRVMKNVTGYDLVKLMTGAYGTLGVLTEVALKVLPDVETSTTLIFENLILPDAVSLMSRALGSPFEVTGTARVGDKTLLRIEGFETSVAYRSHQLTTVLAEYGAPQIIEDHAQSAQIWRDTRDVTSLADHDAVWRISLTPSATPGFLECLDQMHGYDYTLDWGGGLIWLGATKDHLDQAATYHANKGGLSDKAAGLEVLHANVQHNAGLENGHATLIKSPELGTANLHSFQPEAAPLAAITSGLRAKFDPRNILNPGIMT